MALAFVVACGSCCVVRPIRECEAILFQSSYPLRTVSDDGQPVRSVSAFRRPPSEASRHLCRPCLSTHSVHFVISSLSHSPQVLRGLGDGQTVGILRHPSQGDDSGGVAVSGFSSGVQADIPTGYRVVSDNLCKIASRSRLDDFYRGFHGSFSRALRGLVLASTYNHITLGENVK